MKILVACEESQAVTNDEMFQCRHALNRKINDIGEIILHCEITDNFENVTLGNCIGNCEYQEMDQ